MLALDAEVTNDMELLVISNTNDLRKLAREKSK